MVHLHVKPQASQAACHMFERIARARRPSTKPADWCTIRVRSSTRRECDPRQHRLGIGVEVESDMHRMIVVAWLLGIATLAHGADIGQVKVVKGHVTIERAGRSIPVTAGMHVETSDVVKTGADGSVGITMTDNALLSAGPDSV